MDHGCYTFTIFDSYGDGICCTYGNGHYTVTNLTTSEVYGSGGDFGSQESVPFCITVPGLWTGNTSTDWGNSSNWDDSNIPVSGTNVFIPSTPEGSNFPETNTGSGAECNNLAIKAGAHLHVPFNNTLTKNGTLNDNAGTSGLFVKAEDIGMGSLIQNTNNVQATVEQYVEFNPQPDEWWHRHLVSSPVISNATINMYFHMFSFLL